MLLFVLSVDAASGETWGRLVALVLGSERRQTLPDDRWVGFLRQDAAGQQNCSRPQNSKAGLCHVQGPPQVESGSQRRHQIRRGPTGRTRLFSRRGQGGRPEDRPSEESSELRVGAGHLHAHLRDGRVQHGGVPAEERRVHTAARPPGHERDAQGLLRLNTRTAG